MTDNRPWQGGGCGIIRSYQTTRWRQLNMEIIGHGACPQQLYVLYTDRKYLEPQVMMEERMDISNVAKTPCCMRK